MEIRKFKRGDESAISKLHNETVRTINRKDYSNEQIEAWSPIRTNFEKLAKGLENNISYVALIDNKIVGFGDLDDKGKIRRLYTHNDYQSKGVGSIILDKLENEARKLNFLEISLESTVTAKTFYESKGYVCVGKKEIYFNGVKHDDWEMKKKL